MTTDEIVVTEIKFLEDKERVRKAAEIYAKGVARQIKKKKQEEYKSKKAKG